MRLEYDDGIPPDILPILQREVESVAFLFPAWVERLTVYYDFDEDNNSVATCSPLVEYRTMALTFHPRFLSESDRFNATVHEIGHALVRPLRMRIDRVVERFVQPSELADYVTDDLNEAEESVCEDLAVFAAKLRRLH